MTTRQHWERVYESKAPSEVSWFQEHASLSLTMIERTGMPLSAAILDVGAGASTLVDDLLARGRSNVTVLDVSGIALSTARRRLGDRATEVVWLEGDVLEVPLPGVDLWHDRAVFHFLTEPADRSAYVARLTGALRPGGRAIIATFAEDGPTRCSGLPVKRYSPDLLAAELGPAFRLVDSEREEHVTPFGTVQAFTYGGFERE
jgi:SAM-dependent methyltransferase